MLAYLMLSFHLGFLGLSWRGSNGSVEPLLLHMVIANEQEKHIKDWLKLSVRQDWDGMGSWTTSVSQLLWCLGGLENSVDTQLTHWIINQTSASASIYGEHSGSTVRTHFWEDSYGVNHIVLEIAVWLWRRWILIRTEMKLWMKCFLIASCSWLLS